MTVFALLEGPHAADSRELEEWRVFFQIEAQEASLRADGLDPEQIADVIEHGDDARPTAGEDGSLLDSLLSDEERAARAHQRALDLMAEDEEDDE